MLVKVQDEQVLGRTYYKTLPDVNVSKSKGVTIPVVTNLHMLVFVNTGALSVTNMLGGSDGMRLMIIGDGFTTILNNSNIKTSTGANKLLSLLMYEFVSYSNVWYEKTT